MIHQLYLKAYLENYNQYKKTCNSLKLSYQHALEIGIKPTYNFFETEVFDALIIKLSRSFDVLYKQVIKGFFKLKEENNVTFIDTLHLLEKLGVHFNSINIINLKNFRNRAVHEYIETNMPELYKDTLFFTDIFFNFETEINKLLLKENIIREN